IQGAMTSANFFHVMGVNPIFGRTFLSEEEQAGHERVVVISQGLWQRQFAGDPNAIGKQLRLNEVDYTVVGVMPTSFRFPSGQEMPNGSQFNSPTELWVPLVLSADAKSNRLLRYIRAVARLKQGVSVKQAQTEMDTIAKRLEL